MSKIIKKNLFFLSLSVFSFWFACQSSPLIPVSLTGKEVNDVEGKEGLTKPLNMITTGYLLIDPEKKVVLEKNLENELFIPASTAKIPISIAALKVLGPYHRFKTEIMRDGRLRKGILDGDIYLKGGGDPFLSASHLMDFVHQLSKSGLRQVKGFFYYDETELSSQEAICLDDNLSESYNVGVSALSFDFNRIFIRWTSFGEPVTVPHFNFLHLTQSSQEPFPTYNSFRYQKREVWDEWVTSTSLKSTTDISIPNKRPALSAAFLFYDFCRMNRISLSPPIAKRVPPTAHRWLVHKSIPLIEGVGLLLEYSNNLVAELLQMAIAKKIVGYPMDVFNSAQVLHRWLSTNIPDVSFEKSTFQNGSGLSSESRLTPLQLTALLRYADTQKFGQAYSSLLPISGWKGTLLNRLKLPETAFRVWAKTGSLYYVKTLAGYVYTNSGKKLIFSLMSSDMEQRKKWDEKKENISQNEVKRAEQWSELSGQAQDNLLIEWIKKY